MGAGSIVVNIFVEQGAGGRTCGEDDGQEACLAHEGRPGAGPSDGGSCEEWHRAQSCTESGDEMIRRRPRVVCGGKE